VAHDDVHESARDVVHWPSAVADAAADTLAASMQPTSVDIDRRTHEDDGFARGEIFWVHRVVIVADGVLGEAAWAG
jgi:hypothetical protein